MATTTITDYTLEIGWSATKVNKGIKDLEAKIQNLGKKTSGAVDPTAKKPAEARKKKGADLNLLNNRKLALIQQTNDKLRTLRNLASGIDMRVKGGAEAHAQIQKQIKSVEQYRSNLRKATITSQQQLRVQGQVWGILKGRIKNTTAAVKEYTTATRNATSMTTKFMAALKQGRIAAMVAGVTMLTREIYRNGKQWENLRIQLQASFGSAQAGAQQMAFLQKTARHLGVDVLALADGYAKIGVAGRMSNMALEDSQEIFMAASEASRAFGLSTDDTQGVMRAFSQMMGKGQVMMEELKLQLGDRMPSAMGIFAQSMGKTVPEFMALVKAGVVGNTELVNFAKFLRKDIRASGAYAKALNSTEAEQTRFNQALREAGDAFFAGGLGEAMSEVFKMGADFFAETQDFWGLLGLGLKAFVKMGLAFLKVVLIPIQKLVGTIGFGWKKIRDLSFDNLQDSVEPLSEMAWWVNRIYKHFVDLFLISKWIGLEWDELFGNPDKFFKDIQDTLLDLKQNIKYLLGLQDSKTISTIFKGQDPETVERTKQMQIEGMRIQSENEAKAKAGKGGKSAMNVEKVEMTLPIGTPAEQAPEFLYAFLDNQIDGQLAG